ncbi:hypothetical protein AB6A40_003470 [Gnathostoma spinigerum]|uniref:Protein kinase domain-containing protein n=1 Tax=Gnathostoma spinigerum TaxID=75299 RepID=A0ABD6EAV2_9BILA
MVTSMDRNGVSTNVLIAQSSPSSLLHPPHETVEDSHKYNSSSTDSGKPRSPSWSNFHFPPPPPVDDDSHPSTPLLNTASGRRPNVPSRRKTSVDMQYSPRKYTDDSLFYAASNIALSNSSDRNVLPKVNKEAVIMGDILGEGRFTAVHICKVGGCKMAAKVLKGNNPQAESAISDEINILSSLNHPNIVKVLGISEDRRLFMEFVLHRDIRYFLQHVEEDISQKVLLSICSEVAAAMKYLEEQNVIHGHLSPKCVLIGNNLCVKICSPRGKGHHAQLRYSAPESIIANDWTSKSDVWSFAVTVWEILNHCRLRAYDDFSNGDLLENAHRIIAGTQAVYLDFGYSLPEKLAQHLMECWRQKPSERPTFSALHFLLSSSETHSISRNRDANFYASVA